MISARVSVQSEASSSTVCSIKMGKTAAGRTPSLRVGVLGEENKLSNGRRSLTGRAAKDTPGERNLSIKDNFSANLVINLNY